MGKKDRREKKEKRKGHFGAFFGGGFLGFNLCLLLIAGLFCFAYFKVSVNWVNKTFKTEIDLGSEEINSKTISTLVNNAMSLVENKDTYKLKNLKNDFGIEIKDEMFGIDISDLKDVAISDLAEAIENKFGTISADELRNVNGMNLEEEMGDILDKENTYYFNSADDKLYNKSDFTEEVSFEYTLNSAKTQITSKGYIADIDGGEVKIPLWNLPLTVALGDFTSNMGVNTTLYDLEHSYGVTLPSFIKLTEQQKKDTTINELDGVIDSSVVADILGLKKDASSGTYYDDKNNDGIKDSGEEVSFVLNTIAGKQVQQLSKTINELKLSQVFENTNDGILSLISGETEIADIPEAIKTALEETSIEDLITKKVIDRPADYDSLKNNETTILKKDNVTKKKIYELTIPEMIDYCLELMLDAKS